MENIDLCLGSLPGDRQGTSGAGAGRDSMRDVGGRVLRRRAPVIQTATAQQQQQPQVSQTTARAPPAESAALEPQPALTQAGRPRQRMKWTASINENILRFYYKVTNLGQETIGYRQQLYAEFCREYPDIQVSEQRVSDQYRVIIRNNLIPEARRDTIKSEVEREINNQGLILDQVPNEIPDEQIPELPIPETQPDNTPQENNELRDSLVNEMARAVQEFNGTNPLSRPPLPRINSCKKLGALLQIVNTEVLPNYVVEAHTLEYLHMLIYCAATAIANVMGIKIRTRRGTNNGRTGNRIAPWEKRLQGKIELLRRDIGQVTEYLRGVPSRKVIRRTEEIMRNTARHSRYDPDNNTAQQCLDTLKQKLSVYSGRLRRYKVSNNRKSDNALFENSEKTFYRKLNSTVESADKTYPSQEEIHEFWGNQLSTPAAFNNNAGWIEDTTYNCHHYVTANYEPFTTEEVSNVIKELHNWKSPGPDGVQNFWLKKFWCIHDCLSTLINHVISNPQEIPSFLTQGTTYLIPKDQNNTQDPSKYRPITCLPTLYKLVTSCVTRRIYQHCALNNIIEPQQKGCAKGSMGCKEQLIIDSVISNQAFTKKRNLFTAFIDYKKAFDSVPHEWLIDILKIYKVDDNIVTFLRHIMRDWKTKIHLQIPGENNIETENIAINRGLFQGDSLSPLWFCLALNPLSQLLNSTDSGFSIKSNNTVVAKLNHLLYMDDLKLMASTREHLEEMLKTVETFSNDISMQFGLDKCRVLNIVRGKVQPGGFDMQNGQNIEAMGDNDMYKYLGVKQARKIDHKQMKTEITTEFIRRVKQLLRSQLNSKNLFKALNTYACSALSYSFGIVKWTKTDIENLQRKVRTHLTKAQKHHPKSAVERTTLPRYLGGRGLMDIGEQLDKQIANLRTYFQMQAETSTLHRAICAVDDTTPVKLREPEMRINHLTKDEKLRTWMGKPLHGRHPNEVSQDYVDNIASNYWLTSGKMFPETEGSLLAIQDQVIPTRNYLKYIVKDPQVQNDRCRYGCQAQETIQHITGGCQAFAATEYKERHDAVGKILHQEIAIKLGLLQTDHLPYYQYVPESMLEDGNYKLYWDRTVLTDQTVAHNRPDLVLVNKLTRQTTLIDVAIPNNNNLRSKFTEKIAKYRDLEIQIRRQWRMQSTQTIPIVISTTGVIPKNLLESIKRLGLNEHLYKTMQKAVLLATARCVRKFLGDTPAYQVT